MTYHKSQVLARFGSKWRYLEVGVGEIQPFVGANLLATRWGLLDLQQHAVLGVGSYTRADLTIINPHWRANLELLEYRGDSTADPRRAIFPFTLHIVGQEQPVTNEKPLLRLLDRSHGAYFRAAEIHQHPHTAAGAERLRGVVQVGQHGLPDRRRIVGAVDAHTLGTVPHDLCSKRSILSRLRGQRDHDTDVTSVPSRTEDRLRLLGNRLCAMKEAFLRREGAYARLIDATGGFEQGNDGVQGRLHVGLAASERRESPTSQLTLEWTQITAAQGQVQCQISCTCLEGVALYPWTPVVQ